MSARPARCRRRSLDARPKTTTGDRGLVLGPLPSSLLTPFRRPAPVKGLIPRLNHRPPRLYLWARFPSLHDWNADGRTSPLPLGPLPLRSPARLRPLQAIDVLAAAAGALNALAPGGRICPPRSGRSGLCSRASPRPCGRWAKPSGPPALPTYCKARCFFFSLGKLSAPPLPEHRSRRSGESRRAGSPRFHSYAHVEPKGTLSSRSLTTAILCSAAPASTKTSTPRIPPLEPRRFTRPRPGSALPLGLKDVRLALQAGEATRGLSAPRSPPLDPRRPPPSFRGHRPRARRRPSRGSLCLAFWPPIAPPPRPGDRDLPTRRPPPRGGLSVGPLGSGPPTSMSLPQLLPDL